MKSKLLIGIAGLVVIAVAFFTTLWLTAATTAELLAKHVMLMMHRSVPRPLLKGFRNLPT